MIFLSFHATSTPLIKKDAMLSHKKPKQQFVDIWVISGHGVTYKWIKKNQETNKGVIMRREDRICW